MSNKTYVASELYPRTKKERIIDFNVTKDDINSVGVENKKVLAANGSGGANWIYIHWNDITNKPDLPVRLRGYNIENLPNVILEGLSVGDIVVKVVGNQQYNYFVTYKDNVNKEISLVYNNSDFIEELYYDKSVNNEWSLIDKKIIYIEPDDTPIEDSLHPITSGAVFNVVDDLNAAEVGQDGSYIKIVSESKGVVTATAQTFDTQINNQSDNTNSPTSLAVKNYVESEINSLDVGETGQNGSYLQKIKEENGKITATLKAFDLTVPAENASNDTAPTTLAVANVTNQLRNDISNINELIPDAASDQNELADKNFVNSSIATNTANFIGTFDSLTDLYSDQTEKTNNDYAFVRNSVINQDFVDKTALDNYDTTLVTNFDYAWVINSEDNTKFDLYRFDLINSVWLLRASKVNKNDVTLNEAYNRYKYSIINSLGSWEYEYTLNNSSFTSDQWEAINSGITKTLVTKLNGIENEAQVNVLESISINGSPTVISGNKNVDITIPTKTSDLINDGEGDSEGIFTTKAYVDNNFVNLTSPQSITGQKTFLNSPILNNNIGLKSILNNTNIDIIRLNNSGRIVIGDANNVSGGISCYSALSTADSLSGQIDLGASNRKWRDVYISRHLTDGTNNILISDIANKSEIHNGKLYLQKNDTPIGSFGANDSSDTTINIEVPINLSQLNEDTTHRLVTDNDKITWNGKQDALAAQTEYTSQGSSTKVPVISTNTLGQVTSITETNISFPVTSVNGQTGDIVDLCTLNTNQTIEGIKTFKDSIILKNSHNSRTDTPQSASNSILITSDLNNKEVSHLKTIIGSNYNEIELSLINKSQIENKLSFKNDNNGWTFGPAQSSSGIDLGSSGTKWKDLFLSGDLSNGNQRINISQIISKQDALSSQTAYNSMGSSTSVPVISTNSLGQVTNITNTNIDFPVTSVNGSTGAITGLATTTELTKKVDDMTIGIYNGTSGNPKPVRFMSVDYNDCGSEEGVFIRVSMVSGHGNGVSYTFLQDGFFNVDHNGNVSVDVYKYFGQATIYNGVARQYGDIFWVIDTTNKVVDFYVLMGQYATVYSSPYKRLNNSTKGIITQYTSASIYSSGTQNWATQGDIARLIDIPDVSDFVTKSTDQTITGVKTLQNATANDETTLILNNNNAKNQSIIFQLNGVKKELLRGAANGLGIVAETGSFYVRNTYNSNGIMIDPTQKRLVPEQNNAWQLGSTAAMYASGYFNKLYNYDAFCERGVDGNADYAGYFRIAEAEISDWYRSEKAVVYVSDYDDTRHGLFDVAIYIGANGTTSSSKLRIIYEDNDGWFLGRLYYVVRQDKSVRQSRKKVELWLHVPSGSTYSRCSFQFLVEQADSRSGNAYASKWKKYTRTHAQDKALVVANVVDMENGFVPDDLDLWTSTSTFSTTEFPDVDIGGYNNDNWTVGSSYAKLLLRGQNQRPSYQYGSNTATDLALYSDIPTIPVPAYELVETITLQPGGSQTYYFSEGSTYLISNDNGFRMRYQGSGSTYYDLGYWYINLNGAVEHYSGGSDNDTVILSGVELKVYSWNQGLQTWSNYIKSNGITPLFYTTGSSSKQIRFNIPSIYAYTTHIYIFKLKS